MIPTEAQEPLMGPNGPYGHGRRIAASRPRCASCGGAAWPTRIAPAKGGALFKVEYIFECACGEKIVIAEADLWRPRA
jgi:hypothetical protein